MTRRTEIWRSQNKLVWAAVVLLGPTWDVGA
jgi:hypothetical protein